jgi:hypothetical protein
VSDIIRLAKGPTSSPANGAEAMREYLLACPPLETRPLRDQPLFAVQGEPEITGELVDKIFKAILGEAFGPAAARFSLHSMRIGAATALRDAGYEGSEICRALRWAPMPCMQGYARIATDERVGSAHALRGSGAIARSAATAQSSAPTTTAVVPTSAIALSREPRASRRRSASRQP